MTKLAVREGQGYEVFAQWLRQQAREFVAIAAETPNEGLRAVNAGKADILLELLERLDGVHAASERLHNMRDDR